jgi:hypothetical protein
MNNYALIAPTKQQADEPHLLFNGTQSTVNSVRYNQASSKSKRSAQGLRVFYVGGGGYLLAYLI